MGNWLRWHQQNTVFCSPEEKEAITLGLVFIFLSFNEFPSDI